ncbi:MAG: tail fiber domain-containing protein [Planctomycetes bacterium]|nr:tail fiber domain-containing protein [Planctomycetota bacterium]
MRPGKVIRIGGIATSVKLGVLLLLSIALNCSFMLNADIKTRSSSMSIDSDGDEIAELTLTSVGLGVGIGSPSQKLHVAGNMTSSTIVEGTALTLTGSSYFTGTVNFNGNVIINESGNDADFRVEGDNETHLIFADASVNRVGIANSSPSESLDVTGNILLSGSLSAPTIRATSRILLPNGSAATPSVAFINATDTGFFQSSSGNLDLAVDGQHIFSLSGANLTLMNADLKTDRWARRDDNTLLGESVVGADTLSGQGVSVLGNEAGYNLSTDNYVTALGYRALYALDGGSADGTTSIGKSTLIGLTSGQRNTAVGYNAGNAVTSGNNNTLYGSSAGELISTGHNNTSFGFYSLKVSTSDGNSAFGRYALYEMQGGISNVAIGYEACERLISGNYNSAVGYQALEGGGSGPANYSYNVGIGHRAGNDLTSGSNNVFIGNDVGEKITTGSFNVAIGHEVLDLSTTLSKVVGIGYQVFSDSLTGERNTIVGYQAGESMTSGYDNTACGWTAMQDMTTGYENVAMGADGMDVATSAYLNTGVGQDVFANMTTANENVAIGKAALSKVISSSRNTVAGYQSGEQVTTGANNSILGYQSGDDLTTGDNNIFLGRGIGNSVVAGSYNIIVGTDADTVSGDQSNLLNILDLIYGDRANSNLGIGANAPTETLHVVGNVSVSGNVVSLNNGFSLEGGVTINETGAATNFRIESDIDENRFYIHPASGNIGIGTSSPSANLHVVGNVHISNGFVVTGNIIPSANAVYNVGDPSSAWRDIYTNHINIISDKRSKEEIEDLPQGLEEILAFRPVSYQFKGQEKQHMGVVAQEVREVLPELVKGQDAKGLAVNYQQFVPIMVKALGQLDEKSQSIKKALDKRRSLEFRKIDAKIREEVLLHKNSHKLEMGRLQRQLEALEEHDQSPGRRNEN